MIPPPEKFWILNAGRETGYGVDKIEITRAHEGGGIHGKETGQQERRCKADYTH